MRKRKKIVATCLTLALSAFAASPMLTFAQDATTYDQEVNRRYYGHNHRNGGDDDSDQGGTLSTTTIQTQLEQIAANDNSAPIVKAKWEMNGPASEMLGTDDDTLSGAQFDATGIQNQDTEIAVCAIVADPSSVQNENLNGVFADIYAPDSNTPVGDGIELDKLSKAAGLDLFCSDVRSENENLPVLNQTYFDEVLGSDSRNDIYNEICGTSGELQRETAFVYCADATLASGAASGIYTVSVMAQNQWGNSATLQNTFNFMPTTAYLVDFDSIDYGTVKLNVNKGIYGDSNFGTSDKPTARNLGNTPLYIGVMQDDMGFGKTNGQHNIRYGGRVGSNESAWKNWEPSAADPTWLNDALAAGQDKEMDFSVFVKKFPSDKNTWTGMMTLSAIATSQI